MQQNIIRVTNIHLFWNKGIAREGEWCAYPGQHSPRSDKMGSTMNTFNNKNILCAQQILNYRRAEFVPTITLHIFHSFNFKSFSFTENTFYIYNDLQAHMNLYFN
jgi:hypothetical protein